MPVIIMAIILCIEKWKCIKKKKNTYISNVIDRNSILSTSVTN